MDWRDIIVTEGPAEGPRRADGLEHALVEAGFTEIGRLGVTRPGVGAQGQAAVDVRAVWRSADGAITAVPEQRRGGDRLALSTLLRDGTLHHTDVKTGPWHRQDLASAIAAHRAAIEGQLADVVPLDVAGAGAVLRRHVDRGPARFDDDPLLLAVPALTVALAIALSWVSMPAWPVDALGDVDVVATRRLVLPFVAGGAGAVLGVVLTSCVWAAIAIEAWFGYLLAFFLVACSWLDVGTAAVLRLGAAGAGAWALVAAAATAGWLLLARPRVAARKAARLPPDALDAARILRRYGPPTIPEVVPWSADDPHVQPAASRAPLEAAGFVPLARRSVVGLATDQKSPSYVADADLFRSPNGATIAELRTLDGGVPHVTLTTAGEQAIVETRSLPDPGPLSDVADPKLSRGGHRRPVTATALRLRYVWPSLATLRVRDRPRVGLRIAHAGSVPDALAMHPARVAALDGAVRTLEGAPRAIDRIDAADFRRLPRTRTRQWVIYAFGSWLVVPGAIFLGRMLGLASRATVEPALALMIVLFVAVGLSAASLEGGRSRRLNLTFVTALQAVAFFGAKMPAPEAFAVTAVAFVVSVAAAVAVSAWLPRSRIVAGVS